MPTRNSEVTPDTIAVSAERVAQGSKVFSARESGNRWHSPSIEPERRMSELLDAITGKFLGAEHLDKRPGLSQQKKAADELQPSMSESLSMIAEKFLHIDTLDDSQDTSRFVAYLLDAIELFTDKLALFQDRDASLDEHPSAETQDNIMGKSLHRISCVRQGHHHDGFYYEDRPAYKIHDKEDEGKLMGKKFVRSVEKYLHMHPNICFLVIKDHVCTSHSRDGYGESRRGPEPDQLRIVAPLLQRALLEVAEYNPSPPGQTSDYLRYHGLLAPYHFLFHHYQKLIQLSMEKTYEDVLKPLLEFLDENYSQEYEEAISLFGRGLVTAHSIPKLYKPNQMVISQRKSDAFGAYIVSNIHSPANGQIQLSGWSWGYDGNDLARLPWVKMIDNLPEEQTQITNLLVYPAEFASSEDLKALEERGRRFWSMKSQTYICYTGWDRARQYHYVRAVPLPFHLSGLPKLTKYLT